MARADEEPSRSNGFPPEEGSASEHAIPFGSLGAVTLCSMLQLALQFLLIVWLARRFGTSPTMDAFNSAFAIPLAVTSILVGPLPLVLVPELVRLRAEGAEPARWRLATTILSVALGCGGLLAVLGAWLAEPICQLVFAGFDTFRMQQAAFALRWLIWLVPLNALVALLQAVHHSGERYLLPAVSNVAGVGLSFTAIALSERLDLQTVCLALLAGAGLANAILILPLGRRLAAGFGFDLRGLGLRRFTALAVPLFLSAAYSRLDPLVDRSIASFLAPGAIAELGYAQRLMTALATLTASGLSVVIFPKFASLSVTPGDERLPRLIASAWRFLAILLVPCVAAVAVYGEAIVADLFQREAFGPQATEAVARLSVILLGFLVAGSVGEIAAKALYAMSETRLPAVVTVVGFTLGIGLKWILSQRMGIEGVALGTSLYFLCSLAALLAGLYWKLGRGMGERFGGALGQALVGSLAALLVGWVPVSLLEEGGAVVGGAVGLVVYVTVLWWLGNEYVRSLPLRGRR